MAEIAKVVVLVTIVAIVVVVVTIVVLVVVLVVLVVVAAVSDLFLRLCADCARRLLSAPLGIARLSVLLGQQTHMQ